MPATLIGDLTGDEVIWRYMTLDRLINVLDDKALFMASLSAYSASDPYEGYPPPAVLKAVKDHCPESIFYSTQEDAPQDLENFKVFAQRMFQARVVSCWYQSADESEAMWKLYGDTGKGVAIRTTVGKLASALGDDFAGKIARVRYINYTLTDVAEVMGAFHQQTFLDPIFKRSSYAHEREVRA